MYALNLSNSQDSISNTYATAFPFSSTFLSFNVQLSSSENSNKNKKNELSLDDIDSSSLPSNKKQKLLQDKNKSESNSERFSGTISNTSFNRWGLSTDEIKNAKEQSTKSKFPEF